MGTTWSIIVSTLNDYNGVISTAVGIVAVLSLLFSFIVCILVCTHRSKLKLLSQKVHPTGTFPINQQFFQGTGPAGSPNYYRMQDEQQQLQRANSGSNFRQLPPTAATNYNNFNAAAGGNPPPGQPSGGGVPPYQTNY